MLVCVCRVNECWQEILVSEHQGKQGDPCGHQSHPQGAPQDCRLSSGPTKYLTSVPVLTVKLKKGPKPKVFSVILKLSLPPFCEDPDVAPPAAPEMHTLCQPRGQDELLVSADVPGNLWWWRSQDGARQRHFHPLPHSVYPEGDPEHRRAPRTQLDVVLLHLCLLYSL